MKMLVGVVESSLSAGYTDMRKSIGGFCAIIMNQLKEKSNGSALYMFCGKRCGCIKMCQMMS